MTPPVYNPLDPSFRDDPYPSLRRLRQHDPVHWSPVFQVWVLTRYADALASLRDPRLSNNSRLWDNYSKFFYREGGDAPPAEVYRHWMLQLDAPDHTRIRGLVNKAFTRGAIETVRPTIAAVINDLLERVDGREEFDVVEQLAYPLPIRVMMQMLGLPREDYQQIKQWSAQLLPSFGPIMSRAQLEGINATMSDFASYFKSVIHRRHTKDRGDLLEALILAHEEGDRLSNEELIATCILLIFAGHMSTVQLIANGVACLLKHPDQRERLRESEQLLGSAIEEILRFEAPLQVIHRAAREDLDLGGRTIRKGQMVLISIPAANRDPQQFPEPDRFDIGRSDNRHLAFGYASHYCAGAALARLEGELAIKAILGRFTDLRLSSTNIQRESSLLLRGIKSLPVRVLGRAA